MSFSFYIFVFFISQKYNWQKQIHFSFSQQKRKNFFVLRKTIYLWRTIKSIMKKLVIFFWEKNVEIIYKIRKKKFFSNKTFRYISRKNGKRISFLVLLFGVVDSLKRSFQKFPFLIVASFSGKIYCNNFFVHFSVDSLHASMKRLFIHNTFVWKSWGRSKMFYLPFLVAPCLRNPIWKLIFHNFHLFPIASIA